MHRPARTVKFANPVVDEVRAVRRAISAEFGHDLNKLIDSLGEIEARYRDRLIKPRRTRNRRK